MADILEFLEGIFDFISTIIDFVISFFGDLVYLIELTAQFLVQVPSYFSWLPGEVVSALVLLFSIVILYKILGREG